MNYPEKILDLKKAQTVLNFNCWSEASEKLAPKEPVRQSTTNFVISLCSMKAGSTLLRTHSKSVSAISIILNEWCKNACSKAVE